MAKSFSRKSRCSDVHCNQEEREKKKEEDVEATTSVTGVVSVEGKDK